MADGDECAVVDGQERVLREGVPLMADCSSVAILLQLGLEVLQSRRHVGEKVVDRGLRRAVGQ